MSSNYKKNTLHKLNTNIANFHPAILSNHRGLFPIFYAILNRNKHIGISFHKVREKIDYGELISELKIPINKKYGFFYMYKKLYFNNESFKFIKNSILNYKSIKIKKLNKKKLSKYYSYPSLMQIVKFKFIRIFN